MSTETFEMEMGTKPIKEHDWLRKLVGEWRVESEMYMAPGEDPVTGSGTETVEMLGDLWAVATGKATMPNGSPMEYRSMLGYDVSFKHYAGAWFASVSSHLWKQYGELSEDGNTMTLSCEGPHMEKDGVTANYRDIIEFQDEDHRTMTSFGQDESGEWQPFLKAVYTRK